MFELSRRVCGVLNSVAYGAGDYEKGNDLILFILRGQERAQGLQQQTEPQRSGAHFSIHSEDFTALFVSLARRYV